MLKFFKTHIQKTRSGQAGLTFVELIVVIAIFSVMSGVILFNSRGFNNSIALQNLSQDIALQLKRAQTEGSSGKANQCAFLVKPAYGMFFSKSQNQFIYYADLNNSNMYDSGGSVTCPISTGGESQTAYSINTGEIIKNICVNGKSGLKNCTGITDLHVTFTRPNLNAAIKSATFTGIINDAEIEVSTPSGQALKTIVIWPTGQISVE